jgi:hypothetical protein
VELRQAVSYLRRRSGQLGRKSVERGHQGGQLRPVSHTRASTRADRGRQGYRIEL